MGIKCGDPFCQSSGDKIEILALEPFLESPSKNKLGASYEGLLSEGNAPLELLASPPENPKVKGPESENAMLYYCIYLLCILYRASKPSCFTGPPSCLNSTLKLP